MKKLKSVTVFCSANSQIHPSFFTAAEEFSQALARHQIELIYGAATVGLMGKFADAALAAGGVVRGSITHDLATASREMAHAGLDELVYTDTLAQRKEWLIEKGEAFAIFPGGLGTLDEVFEVLSLKSLGAHNKPIAFVNLNGFWQSQIRVITELQEQGFMRARVKADGITADPLFTVCDTVSDLLKEWKIE